MLKAFFFWSGILAGLLASSQIIQYAPDLRWDSIKTEVGFANPNRFPVSVTLKGYAESGDFIDEVQMEIPTYGRLSFPTADIFPGANLSFLQLESPVEVGAYVLYNGEGDKSLVPFSSTAGNHLFVPHIARDTQNFYTETVIANFSPEKLGLMSQPFVDPVNAGLTPDQLGPTALPSEENQLAVSRFKYLDLYPEITPTLQWDIIQADSMQGLVGVEHFGLEGVQRASLSLPRSPFQELIISHIPHDRNHFWTGLVLVNTKNGIVPLEIQSYMDDGTPYQHIYYEMQPFEKKTFLIGEMQELGISDIAGWLKVSPYEQAIVGYQVFGSPQHTFVAGMEPAMLPTNMITLPYTPTNDDEWSGFGIINPTDSDICVQIGGLDDAGNVIAVEGCKGIHPHSKFIATVEDFFGDKAKDISWVRINTTRGSITGFALVGNRDRTELAALQGISTFNNNGTIFSANFEHDTTQTLFEQGWKEIPFHPNHKLYSWTELFTIESYYEAVNGVKHLRAPYSMDPITKTPITDTAMMSPFFEIPVDKENLYLSFYLRLIDPELVQQDDRYAALWREEGSNRWNWFGLTGIYIQDLLQGPFNPVSEQAIGPDVFSMTPWIPFELKLPSSIVGKRIQVGIWYNAAPAEGLNDPVPYLWADFIRVTTNSVIPEYMRPYIHDGHGTFYFDDSQTD